MEEFKRFDVYILRHFELTLETERHLFRKLERDKLVQ